MGSADAPGQTPTQSPDGELALAHTVRFDFISATMAHPPILRPLSLSLRTTCLSSRGKATQQFSASLRFTRGKASKADVKPAAKPTPSAPSTSQKAEAVLQKHAAKGEPTDVEKEFLPWAEYLAIRKNKRRWETVRSCVSF